MAVTIVAWFHSRHILADRLDDPERFVAQDQVIVPGRRIAVESVVDFAVGRIDTDFQDADEDSHSPGDIVELGLGDVLQMNTVRRAGRDGDRFHHRCAHASEDHASEGLG